jgi:hypothetical protein
LRGAVFTVSTHCGSSTFPTRLRWAAYVDTKSAADTSFTVVPVGFFSMVAALAGGSGGAIVPERGGDSAADS